MTTTTYNVRKLTSEFAKDQQLPQPQSSSTSQPTSPSFLQQAPLYHQQTAAVTAAVTETMYDEPVSYVSSVVFEVLPQEPEAFHFGAQAAESTSGLSALYFEQQSQPQQSRPVLSLPLSIFAAHANTALIPISSSMSSMTSSSSCVPHHSAEHWTYAQQTQTQTQTQAQVQAQTQAQHMMPSFFPVPHTPHPSVVAQHQRHNQHYHFSSPSPQHYHNHNYQQTNDPILSPPSQDLGLGSLADLSDLDNNSPVLSGYGGIHHHHSNDLDELLKDVEYTLGDSYVFERDDHFDFATTSLSAIQQQQQQQQQQSVPAPPPATPATVMIASPQLPSFSPIFPAAAPFAVATPPIQFHISSPTPSPLSPPLVPYSPSAPFLIHSNLFQNTSQQTPSSGTSSSSSNTVDRSSGINNKLTLKSKSRKRTQATSSTTPISSSTSSNHATASPPAAVVSSISYLDTNGEKRFRCAWEGCAQDFERHHNCKAHYSTHTGERHFKCDHPGCQSKSFRQKGDLTRHQRIHTNERPYACGGSVAGCDMAYGRCDQKTKHERKCHFFLALGL
ncbi:hypothetical protein BGZ96_007464 [Linnemannia gamsii]|uniref:C2H2-type domain-containing protein n=1 Tax=Linnemannia gamsii TaxID=64522 RepID=A0ABQ7K2M5_9FUNG|nr:hypothetical protein BGZ96_007464 [Linnemannia gamsii]